MYIFNERTSGPPDVCSSSLHLRPVWRSTRHRVSAAPCWPEASAAVTVTSNPKSLIRTRTAPPDACRTARSEVKSLQALQPQLQGELGPGADPFNVWAADRSPANQHRHRQCGVAQSSFCGNLRHTGDTAGGQGHSSISMKTSFNVNQQLIVVHSCDT